MYTKSRVQAFIWALLYKGWFPCSDVIYYLEYGRSHDAAAPPATAMIKWRTPPTADEMWGVWSDKMTPRGFAFSHTKLEQKVTGNCN